MIISPKKRNALLKLANTMTETPNSLEDGEFSVDALPQTESDGSITLDPSTLLGRWDEWETSIPTDLRVGMLIKNLSRAKISKRTTKFYTIKLWMGLK